MRRGANFSIGLGLISILLAGSLWAQAGISSQARAGLSPVIAAFFAKSLAAPANKPHDDSFVIGNDDILAVNVWKEPDISRSIPVRSDGKISLPLVGEVQAAGRTPLQLERDITSRLRKYIAEPEVTVMVQQINSQKFNILGQVQKPGSYPLTRNTTVLDAIAEAQGFLDFAKKKSIYILRPSSTGGESRIAFNYNDVIKGKKPRQNIMLQPGDTVIVP